MSKSLLLQTLFKMYSNLQNTTLIKCRLLKVINHKLRHQKVSAKSKDTNNWHVRHKRTVNCHMLTLSVIEYFFAFLTGFDMLKYFQKFGLKQSFNFVNIGCFKECVITLILQPNFLCILQGCTVYWNSRYKPSCSGIVVINSYTL